MRRLKLTCICVVIVLVCVSTSFGDLIQQRQRADLYFKEGVYHFNQREYQAAATKFQQALSIEPEHLVARYWLGKTYYQSGYLRNALLEWQDLVRFQGNDVFLENKVNRLLLSRFESANTLFPRYVVSPRALTRASLLMAPMSVFVDEDERYFISGYASNNIVVLDKYGDVLHEIVLKEYDANPYDVVKNSRGDIFISDFTNNRVYVFDSQYRFVKALGKQGIREGEFYGPQGMTVDADGYLYVVDKGNHRVQKFAPSGAFLLQFGGRGGREAELRNPSDVCVLESFVYVSDTDNKKIQVFDSRGNWLKSIGENQFMRPVGMKVFASNELLVVDELLGLVKLTLKPYQFEVIATLGDTTQYTDVAFDGNALLYLTQPFYNNVSTYVPEQMKHSNLNIEIIQSSIPNYENKNIIRSVIDWLKGQSGKTPVITHRVKVEDQFGNPVFGLTEKHFKAYDHDLVKPVVHMRVVPDSYIKKNFKLVFLNERSYAMQFHQKRLEEISHTILTSLSKDDKVEVVNFNREYRTDQVFTSNRLDVLDALMNGMRIQTGGLQVSGALYHAVSRAYSDIESQGAVVLFLSGKVDEESFQVHGHDVCVNFAKNNAVPVYVIAFEEETPFKDELADLAAGTRGAYYSAYASNTLQNFMSHLKAFRVSEYYVQYESGFKISAFSQWRDFKVEVRFNDIFGQDQSGYYTYKVN